MASSSSSLQLFFISFIFLLHLSIASITLPVTIDASSHQYLTRIHMGNPPVPVTLLLDLGGPLIWVDRRASGIVPSSHRRPLNCGSIQCSMAHPNDCGNCNFRNPQICGLYPENPITRMTTHGELAEDVFVAVGSSGTDSIPTVRSFLFASAPSPLLKGLASGVHGVLGLGRSKIAYPSQTDLHRKFAVCLSSGDGVIFSGEHDILKSLTYTPLVTNFAKSAEYYITVKSIHVNGKRLSINPSLLSTGGTKLSTILPYTTMESTIYDTFSTGYVKTAVSMNMTLVAPVAPFGVCFGSDGSDDPTVPAIDLVLQSEMVKWRVQGRNLMVKVSGDVMCLGILNGGSNFEAAIVIGSHQLEDNLLEFDLGTSMLGFSSSNLRRKTSCSDLQFLSKPSSSIGSI